MCPIPSRAVVYMLKIEDREDDSSRVIKQVRGH